MMQINKWDDTHRPWPLPHLPWGMHQTWSQLLFIHYEIRYDILREHVPRDFTLDSFEGKYYIAVVPFQMSNVHLRYLPAIPTTETFPELNVRTYVIVDGKPGVYFFSLDAASLLAVRSARSFFHLPYYHAEMRLNTSEHWIEFKSIRKENRDVKLHCKYRPISAPYTAQKGTLEYWMVERYCLYTQNIFGTIVRCDILHMPWSIQ